MNYTASPTLAATGFGTTLATVWGIQLNWIIVAVALMTTGTVMFAIGKRHARREAEMDEIPL